MASAATLASEHDAARVIHCHCPPPPLIGPLYPGLTAVLTDNVFREVYRAHGYTHRVSSFAKEHTYPH